MLLTRVLPQSPPAWSHFWNKADFVPRFPVFTASFHRLTTSSGTPLSSMFSPLTALQAMLMQFTHTANAHLPMSMQALIRQSAVHECLRKQA